MLCRTPANSRKRAFTLVEMLIAVMITLIMVGVAGSMLADLVSMHQLTVEQSTAKRRAQDVFNILAPAMRSAGLGVPSTKSAAERAHYFDNEVDMGWSNAHLASWNGPIEVVGKSSRGEQTPNGDMIRVMYAVPTGIRFSGGSTPDPTDPAQVGPLAGVSTLGFIAARGDAFDRLTDQSAGMGITIDATSDPHDPRSLITFPGAHGHPIYVNKEDHFANDGTGVLELRAAPPFSGTASDAMTEVLPRGVVYPYSELCMFRASIAYVANNTFYLLDIDGEEDPFADGVPDASSMSGFRVEGVKAARFFLSSDSRELTAWILIEGDSDDAKRSAHNNSVAAVKDRTINVDGSATKLWESVAFDADHYYEDAFMTWRLRNVSVR